MTMTMTMMESTRVRRFVLWFAVWAPLWAPDFASAHWHSHPGAGHADFDAVPHSSRSANNNNNGLDDNGSVCLPFPTPFKTELSKYSLPYPFMDKGMSIYTDLRIHCNGYILEWHFLSAVTVIWGLHLAVFRQFVHNKNEFALMSDTYINGMTTRSFGDTWAVLRLQRPIKVQAGDFLGAFYDRNVTTAYGALSLRAMGRQVSQNDLTVQGTPFITSEEAASYRPNTYLFYHTAEDLARRNFIVDRTDAFTVERLPGLYVILSSVSPSEEEEPTSGIVNHLLVPKQVQQEPQSQPQQHQPSTTPPPVRVSEASNNYRNRPIAYQQMPPFESPSPVYQPQLPEQQPHFPQQQDAILNPHLQQLRNQHRYAIVPRQEMPYVPYYFETTKASDPPTTTTATKPTTRPPTTPQPILRKVNNNRNIPVTLAPFPTTARRRFNYKPTTQAASLSRCYGAPVYYNCAKLMIKFYYDPTGDVCRQYLYCSTASDAGEYGFAENEDCMATCSTHAKVPMIEAAMRSGTTEKTTPTPVYEVESTDPQYLLPKITNPYQVNSQQYLVPKVEETTTPDQASDEPDPLPEPIPEPESVPEPESEPEPVFGQDYYQSPEPEPEPVNFEKVRDETFTYSEKKPENAPYGQQLTGITHYRPIATQQASYSEKKPENAPYGQQFTGIKHYRPIATQQDRLRPLGSREQVAMKAANYEDQSNIDQGDDDYTGMAIEDDGDGVGSFVTPYLPYFDLKKRH